VELYIFFLGTLAWIATITVLWPLNGPVIALAYKIQFVIYIGLPVLVLFIINAALGVWNWPLSVAYDYLKTPT
jgi:hypothetical protein